MVMPYVDSARVVVYLRRPDQHLTSLYSEMIRWGDARAPGLTNLRPPAGHGYDYDRLLDRWASVFGEAAIEPQIFERPPGSKFDVVEHFIKLCGLTLKAGTKKTANEALSLAAQLVLVELARRINGLGMHANVSSHSWRVLVEAAAATLPGKSWQPTQAEAAAYNARFAENHERVRQRWFPERETLFSTDFSALPTEAPKLDTAALLDACLRVTMRLGEKTLGLEDELAKAMIPAAEQAGNDQRLQRNLAKRIHLFPDNIEARLKLARLLAKDGDHDAAERLVDAALKIDPDHAEAVALRAEFEAQTEEAATESAFA
jgi:tetratricopeptide (TPR) repeat protein